MERKRKRTRAYVRSYYRMALLALAAMVTARLVLLMIDMELSVSRPTPSFWCSAAGSSRPGRPRERRERNAQLLLRLLRSSP